MIDPFIFVCAVFGLAIGSFANVCVHRLPEHKSIISPGSHCPACREPIAWYDNIPVISFLLLKGRCRHCQTTISLRYPFLELCIGASWAYLAWHFGPSIQLAMALSLVSLLWILSLIDLETGLLPDVLTLPGIVVGFAFSLWAGNPVDSLVGAVAGYGVFWAVARAFLLFTGREGLGYGDFKLLAMLGAFFGWQALPSIVLLASLAGIVIGSLFLLTSGKHARSQIPFGPFLAAGGVIWLLGWEHLVPWFASLVSA